MKKQRIEKAGVVPLGELGSNALQKLWKGTGAWARRIRTPQLFLSPFFCSLSTLLQVDDSSQVIYTNVTCISVPLFLPLTDK